MDNRLGCFPHCCVIMFKGEVWLCIINIPIQSKPISKTISSLQAMKENVGELPTAFQKPRTG